ncbi:hypothetical protein [Nonomuraea sp. NEAU-A123]|uniref:hypothetical protein n=1 Tax=Nonomuraea sp. NEAU-A123 TaxID=2839649 RepID=UPI001BE3F40A|nr:hypothetical protein [Nonomuraea sp. NEAU-A123]MBT2226275.1 hypothetical protein [Nonomuraea sp. NEAU-A123]
MTTYLIIVMHLCAVWCFVLVLPAGRRAVVEWWHRVEASPDDPIRAELCSLVGALVYLSAVAVIYGVVLTAGWLLVIATAATPR